MVIFVIFVSLVLGLAFEGGLLLGVEAGWVTERGRVGDAVGRFGTYSAGARRIGAHQPHRSAVVARRPAGRVPGKRRFSSGFENPASRGACPRPRSPGRGLARRVTCGSGVYPAGDARIRVGASGRDAR